MTPTQSDPAQPANARSSLQLLRYGIAHELSQPLAAIRITLATMDVGHDPELAQSELLIASAVELMQRRVLELSTLARVGGEKTLTCAPTRLASCAAEVVHEPGSPAGGRREDIVVRRDPAIHGDPDTVRLAVRGLLRAALKLCSEPPVVLEPASSGGLFGVAVRYQGSCSRKFFDISTAEAIAAWHGGRLETTTVAGSTTLAFLLPTEETR